MLDRSTIWPYEDGEPGEFYYQRYGHPAGVEAERALGELEGGQALLFPSGSGAITALVLALLEPGKTVALTQDAYYGTPVLMKMLERWGLRVVEFDQTGPPPEGADLVWVEAPSNPLLTMPDLEAAAAHPGAAGRRLDRSDAGLPPATRARRRLRPAQRDEVPGRPPRRAARRRRLQVAGGPRAPARVPDAKRDRRVARRGLAPTPEPQDTAGAHGAHHRKRAGTRPPPGGAFRQSSACAIPGFGGLMSFDVAGGGEAARRVETSTG